MRIKKNQLAMFHTHTLSNNAIDYIITHVDAVKFINVLEKNISQYDIFSDSDKKKFNYLQKLISILNELKQEIDIFDKKL